MPEPYFTENDGFDEVVRGIQAIANERKTEGPKLTGLTTGEQAYANWLKDKTPENLSKAVEAFYPTINSEITRYSGPKTMLRSQAKILTVKALKSFNPMSGARLNSWVVTNLKPLSRYSNSQKDVKIPEVAARQAAAVNRAMNEFVDDYGREPTDEELADELGMTVKRVRDVRKKAVASVASSSFDEMDGDDISASAPGVVTPSKIPFAQEAIYRELDSTDRFIFDSITGLNGAQKLPAKEVAARLGISPAAVSQRAKAIGDKIAYIVNNG